MNSFFEYVPGRARYSAYVSDKRALDLRDVPVEHYDLKLQQPREGPER